jgi:hypothetical protein
MFSGNNLLSGAQGMFGGLRRGFQRGGQALHPYSNRLMLAGLGMLGGGPSDAMKGLVAGSALDTEDADRRKLNEAIQGLMDDTSGTGLLAKASPAERAYLLASPPTLSKVMADQMSPPSAGVTINTGGNLPTGYRFIDPNNPSAGAERIEGVHGSEAEQKSEALLTMVEPDYQTALSTFSSLSNPADLAASYGGNIGRYFQSADYQVATDAITNIAQSYLYSASGQAAPDAEVRRMAGLVTPTLTDKPEAIAMKKQRLGAMVQAIRAKTGAPPLVSPDDPLGIR